MTDFNLTWTEKQQEVLDFKSNLCVVAGAGSGKTMTLVGLLLLGLEGQVFGRRLDLANVLALTYTEKAAREMRQRVRRALAGKIRSSSESDLDFWLRQRRFLDRAAISTIHGFCLGVLREFFFEVGLDPEFSVLDEKERDTLLTDRREAMLNLIDKTSPELLELLDYYPWMSRGRRWGLDSIVNAIHAHCRTFGRPVRPAAPRAFSLEPSLSDILKSADMIEQLVAAGRIPPDKGYHALTTGFMNTVRAIIPPSLISEKKERILDELPRLSQCLIGNWFAAKPAKDLAKNALDQLKAERDWRLIQPLKEKLLKLVDQVAQKGQTARQSRAALDFDDLLLLTKQLLAENTEVRRRLKDRYQLILVDEFQDTNRLQADILAYLSEATEGETFGEDNLPGSRPLALRRLLICGDPKQSIYRFRGAEVEVFDRFKSVILSGEGGAGGGLVYLNKNFRSQHKLIEFYNIFFSDIPLSVGSDPKHASLDHHQEWVRESLNSPPAIILQIPSAGNATESRLQEARTLSAVIKELLSGQAGVRIGEEGRLPELKDMVILLRRFTHLKIYEQALRQAGLPYHTVRGQGFYQCPEVMDLIDFLHFLAYPQPGPSWLGLFGSPLLGVSDETLTRLAWPSLSNGRKDLSAYLGPNPEPWPLGLSLAQLTALEAGRDILDRLGQEAGRAWPAQLIEEIVEATDYLSVLAAQFQGEQKVANVQRFIEISRRRPWSALFFPRELAAYFRTRLTEATSDPEAPLQPGEAQTIQIMTIHQAKGLEFPIVFIPDCGARPIKSREPVIFSPDDCLALRLTDPTTGQLTQADDYAEFRQAKEQAEEVEYFRLLYVAATRAKDFLVFSESTDAQSGPWRKVLDNFAAQRPELLSPVSNHPSVLKREAEKPGSVIPPAPDSSRTPVDRQTRGDRIIARVFDRPMVPPSSLTMTVTGLAQYLICPRKFYLETILGLPTNGAPPEAESGSAWSPRQRGILFHHLLETLDLGLPPDQDRLAQEAIRQAGLSGWTSDSTGAQELGRLVSDFLDGAWGLDLRASWEKGELVQRESPLWLLVRSDGESPDLILTGEIDLFYLSPDGPARLLDYKYARPGHESRYAAQVKAYAWGLLKAGLTRPLEAGLYFTGPWGGLLKEIPLPEGWTDEFVAELRQAARGLGRMMRLESEGEVAGPETCPEPGCGYKYACR